MSRETRRFKQSWRRYGAGMSLKEYARDVAEQPGHSMSAIAAGWLHRKGLSALRGAA